MSNRSSRKLGRQLGARVESVRRRIEHWRETRAKRTHMPAALWDAAVSLAREHGLWVISQELRVNYENLKDRLARRSRRRATPAVAPAFVELDAGPLVGPVGRTGAVVELTGADGARLTIRLGERDDLDLGALADGFWRRQP
jgi:hypothetical protein